MRGLVALLLAGIAGCSPSSRKLQNKLDEPAATPPAPVATPAPPAPAPSPPREDPSADIITDEIVKMNSAPYGKPGAKFRTGSVSKIAIPPARKTEAGFQVQFASHAMITTPTVYERKVLVSGGFKSKQMYAYEAATGKPLWGIDLHDDGPSSPACEDAICVINTESCTMFAVEAATGKHLWSYWLGDPLTSSPTIANGRVFSSYPQAATDGKPRPPNASHALAAFDLKSGVIQWQVWLDSDVMSAPVAVGEFVYVTTFHGTMIKLEQATGAIRYAMKARATSAPIVTFADGVEQTYYTRRDVTQSADDEAIEAVVRADHNSPKTKWTGAKKPARYIDKKAQDTSPYAQAAKAADASNGFGNGAPPAAAPQAAMQNVGVNSVSSMQAFQGSRAVFLKDRSVNTMGDEVVATNNETGDVLWKLKLPGDLNQGGFLGTAPLAAGGHVLVATLRGEVLRIDPKLGTSITTYKVGAPVRSQPVVADGWIYVGTEDGKLVAIDTKDPALTGWSSWGGNAQRTGIPR